MIKYWIKLLTQNRNSLLFKTYNMLKTDVDSNKTYNSCNWAYHIKTILDKCGLSYIWLNQYNMLVNFESIKAPLRLKKCIFVRYWLLIVLFLKLLFINNWLTLVIPLVYFDAMDLTERKDTNNFRLSSCYIVISKDYNNPSWFNWGISDFPNPRLARSVETSLGEFPQNEPNRGFGKSRIPQLNHVGWFFSLTIQKFV